MLSAVLMFNDSSTVGNLLSAEISESLMTMVIAVPVNIPTEVGQC